MRHMILIEMDDVYEPCGNFYADISKETFKFSGILLASSVCMGGSAPNFFSPWIFEVMFQGSASVLESLPKVMVAYSVTRKFYNQVSFLAWFVKRNNFWLAVKQFMFMFLPWQFFIQYDAKEFYSWFFFVTWLLTLLFLVPRWAVDNTDLPLGRNISQAVNVKIVFTRTFFKEFSISFLMVCKLIDFALAVLKLLMFKFCGIIGISKIEFDSYSGTERVNKRLW